MSEVPLYLEFLLDEAEEVLGVHARRVVDVRVHLPTPKVDGLVPSKVDGLEPPSNAKSCVHLPTPQVDGLVPPYNAKSCVHLPTPKFDGLVQALSSLDLVHSQTIDC